MARRPGSNPASKLWVPGIARVFVYCIVAGLLIEVRFFPGDMQSRGFFLGVLGGAAVVTAGMAFQHIVVVRRLRRYPLLCAVVFRSILTCAILYVAILTSGLVRLAARGELRYLKQKFDAFSLSRDMQTSLVCCGILLVLYILAMGVTQKLGPGVLLSWVLGRYRRPREEERIFMFLDLRASTTLAEELGNLKFSALVRDVFADLTSPIVDYRAEISHYIGDAVVLTWRTDVGLPEAACVRFYLAVEREFQMNSQKYMKQYGIVPSFKAGAHMGTVVVTEVGLIKSEIVYHGDVLNTTSRLEGLCGQKHANLLISEELAQAVGESAEFTLTCLGPHTLKGKEHKVTVYRVDAASE